MRKALNEAGIYPDEPEYLFGDMWEIYFWQVSFDYQGLHFNIIWEESDPETAQCTQIRIYDPTRR